MKDFKSIIAIIAAILLSVLLVFGIYTMITTEDEDFEASKVTETMEAEITNMNITSTYSDSIGSVTKYLVSVYNKEIGLAEVVEVSEEMYASLKVGYMVSVTKTTTKYDTYGSYKITGVVNSTPSD